MESTHATSDLGEVHKPSPIFTKLWLTNSRKVFEHKDTRDIIELGAMISRFDALNRAFTKPGIMPAGQAARCVLFEQRNYKPQQMLSDIAGTAQEEDGVAEEVAKDTDLASGKDDEDAAPATPHIERLHRQMAQNGWLVLHPPPGVPGLQPQYIRADGSSPQPNCYQFCEVANDLDLSDEPANEPADKPADDEHDSHVVIDKSNNETEPLELLGSAALLDCSSPLDMPPRRAQTLPIIEFGVKFSIWEDSSEEAKERESSTNPTTPENDAVKALNEIGDGLNSLREAFEALLADLDHEESEQKEKEAARAFEAHLAELDREEHETQRAYVGDLDDLALVEADDDEKYLQERTTLPWDGRQATEMLLPDGAWNRLAISNGGLEPLCRLDKFSPRFHRSLSPIFSIPPAPAPTPKAVIPVKNRSSWIY